MVKYNGDLYTYVHNLQGDIVAILDNTGATVVEYKYDAWGKPVPIEVNHQPSTLEMLNPFRYRGYVFDEETGLYYLRSRYYSPVWSRFVNADYLLIGNAFHNLFTYCSNNPLVFVDENGSKDYTSYHKEVQDAIVSKGGGIGLAIEVSAIELDTSTGKERGRVDLIDWDMHYVWEIKKATYMLSDLTKQVKHYLSGKFEKEKDVWIEGSQFEKGPILPHGRIDAADHVTFYWSVAKGTVYYMPFQKTKNGLVPMVSPRRAKQFERNAKEAPEGALPPTPSKALSVGLSLTIPVIVFGMPGLSHRWGGGGGYLTCD